MDLFKWLILMVKGILMTQNHLFTSIQLFSGQTPRKLLVLIDHSLKEHVEYTIRNKRRGYQPECE